MQRQASAQASTSSAAPQHRTPRPVYPIPELAPVVPGPAGWHDYRSFHSTDAVLCIDNGATTLRAGWGTERDPRIVVDNIAAKYKDRKFNRQVMLAGGEVFVDATSRANTRVPYENDVVVNFDAMVRPPPSSLPEFPLAHLLTPTPAGEHPRLYARQARSRLGDAPQPDRHDRDAVQPGLLALECVLSFLLVHLAARAAAHSSTRTQS